MRCREALLSGILEDLDQRNVYDYLKGMVTCHRVHLFDVVNQYRAIFNNDKSGNEENYDGGLLFSWAMQQVSNHLTTLQVMLPNITEGGSLSNILDQCMVRTGFRSLFSGLFFIRLAVIYVSLINLKHFHVAVLCNGSGVSWVGFPWPTSTYLWKVIGIYILEFYYWEWRL